MKARTIRRVWLAPTAYMTP